MLRVLLDLMRLYRMSPKSSAVVEGWRRRGCVCLHLGLFADGHPPFVMSPLYSYMVLYL